MGRSRVVSLYDIRVKLIAEGPQSANNLRHAFSVSQPTFSRIVQNSPMNEGVLVRRYGKGKSSIYVAPRKIRDLELEIPLFEISEMGEIHGRGYLAPFEPRGFLWNENSFKVFPGLPYFLSDQRPQGFLGRSFSKKYPELNLPQRLGDWSENDCCYALSKRGEDSSGNLLLGQESFERHQKKERPRVILKSEKNSQYSALCEEALTVGFQGSSAAGEQPKFTAVVEVSGPERVKHVIVKFSPLLSSAAGERWSDLLVCEFLALQVLGGYGINVSQAEIIQSKNRLFLEVHRFDRMGPQGRKGVLSAGALDDEYFGRRDRWSNLADRLHKQKILSMEDNEKIKIIECFGGLIANTDRHFGNLSFFWSLGTKQIQLAPVYDMLPMHFSPSENGQIVEREFVFEKAQSNTLDAWKKALPLAESFWDLVSQDKRISPKFRKMAQSVNLR